MDQNVEQLLGLCLEMKGLGFIPGCGLIGISHVFLLLESMRRSLYLLFVFALFYNLPVKAKQEVC
jgi:hypothetical protein